MAKVKMRHLLLAAVFLFAPALVSGQGPDADGKLAIVDMPGKWWKNPRVIEALKLSTEQIDKIEEIFFENSKKLIDLKGRLTKTTMDFGRVSESEKSSRDQVLVALDQVLSARSDLARATVIMQLEIRAQLSPEQRLLLKKLRENLRRDRQDLDNRPRRPLNRNRALPPSTKSQSVE